jgi:hypothetical protein
MLLYLRDRQEPCGAIEDLGDGTAETALYYNIVNVDNHKATMKTDVLPFSLITMLVRNKISSTALLYIFWFLFQATFGSNGANWIGLRFPDSNPVDWILLINPIPIRIT